MSFLGNEPIDAVYTWVDGNDQDFRNLLQQYAANNSAIKSRIHDAGESRYYDNQELRFSLRSLERFAAWVRRVYIVTNGQIPRWVNRDNSRLSIVTHESIFADKAALPTFNSEAIEWSMSRIPGLSRYFLYFNDDFFLGRTVTKYDFCSAAGGQRLYLDRWLLPVGPEAGNNNDAGLIFTGRLLDARFGVRGGRRWIAHVPRLYDRQLIAALHEIWPEQTKTVPYNRFRSPTDLSLETLYSYYLVENPETCRLHEHIIASDIPRYYRLMRIGHTKVPLPLILLKTLCIRPLFFCINDGTSDLSHRRAQLARFAVRLFLNAYYPRRSSFESR